MVGRYVKEQAADWSRGWRQQRQLATAGHLPRAGVSPILPRMFVVSEEAVAAIRIAYEQDGELSSCVGLFAGLANNENTRLCARTIAGWQPLPPLPVKKACRSCRTKSSTP
jgi:hypothetical protein